MFEVKNYGAILRIDPPRTAIVLWEGQPRRDLLTFDDAGYKLLFEQMSMNGELQEDVSRINIKIFLNTLLSAERYDFTERGPIHLDEQKIKSILRIRD